MLIQLCELLAVINWEDGQIKPEKWLYVVQSRDGKSPLHMTAVHGRFTRSQTLIQNGESRPAPVFSRTVDSCAASIELFTPGGEIDSVDKDGNTPLHIAARYGHELLINTLITSGADCTRSVSLPVDNGHAPLVLLLTQKTVVSAKTRSPRHVPSPLGCLECSLGVLQEAPVLR